jgi:Coenzyme PQQ synthesis protein D (PqqD)
MSTIPPAARTERLMQRQLPNELLVYDLARHRASCLNRIAMLTWRRCDGRTAVAQIAEALREELQLPVDERAVWLALVDLEKAHLLEGPVTLPDWAAGYSRRQWVAEVGKAAAALVPVVASILSPTAAAAQSAISPTVCSSRTTASCGGEPCTTKGNCKIPKGMSMNCQCG